MRLRNRDIAEQRASSKAVVKDGLDYTDCLPGELMQMLAGLLRQEDVARASMVCKSWARVFRAGEGNGLLHCKQQGMRGAVTTCKEVRSCRKPRESLQHKEMHI